jgi:D-amino peptidase
VLVIYDMEGLSGVDRLEMTQCADSVSYAAGQDRLVADVNAVIEGLAAAGAVEIGVIDRHGSGCQEPDLPPPRLDRRATAVREGSGFNAIAQGTYDAVALVGGHASPGWGGFLEHVGSFGIERIIKGRSVSESEQQALAFGNRGIPIVFASGDDRLRAQLLERMPWVTFVEVKRATSRTAAALRPAAEVWAALTAQAKLALDRRANAKALALVPPFTGAFRPVWPESLELLSAIPGLDIRDGMIRVSGATGRELNDAINKVQRLVASFWWAEAFWEAAKREPKLERFADSLFMVRWQAGPPAVKPPPP